MEHTLNNLLLWPKSGFAGMHGPNLRKFICIMKYTGLILLIACMHVSATALSQKVSFTVRNVKLESVFKQIREQTAYNFLYKNEVLAKAKPVTISVTALPLTDALDQLFKEQGLSYTIFEKTILVKEKEIRPVTKDALNLWNELPHLNPIPMASVKTPDVLNNKIHKPEYLDVNIRGRVTGTDDEALPGVTILLKGSQQGTISDATGAFSISVPDRSAVLVFSFVGYLSQDVPVGNNSVLNITLLVDNKSLDEVVVVGYGTQKKRDLTGSVASISKEELRTLPLTSADQALQGKVAGVQVTQTSGEPGGGITVRIRGGNSIQASNEPLFVVDGIPFFNSLNNADGGLKAVPASNPLTTLNPNDIESIDILKDASATAIYGSRGANGVVLITTKKGKTGKPRIDFDMYRGIQTPTNLVEMASAKEYATYINEAFVNNGGVAPFKAAELETLGEGTDWLKEVTQRGKQESYNISMAGGTETTKYAISANYLNQEGVLLASRMQRGALRINLDQAVTDKLKVGTRIQLSRVVKNRVPTGGIEGANGGVVTNAMIMAPTLTVQNENQQYNDNTPPQFSAFLASNPVGLAKEPLLKNAEDRVIGNVFADYTLLKGLSLNVSMGADMYGAATDIYYPTTIMEGRLNGGVALYQNTRNLVWLNENILTYQPVLPALHTLTLTGGVTQQYTNLTARGMRAEQFTTDYFENDNMGAAGRLASMNSRQEKESLLSWLGRANYTFKNRYLLTATLRSDGSSKFGDGNKWGLFPSMALGWRIIEEGFLRDHVKFLSDLKLRASYGLTGNEQIGRYQSLSAYTTRNYQFGENLRVGFVPQRVANPDLKWETTAQYDIGLDVGLFGNRITLDFDYYYKKTRDLLMNVSVPRTSGYTSSLQNSGTLENKGVELNLNAQVLTGKFKWQLGGNIAFNKNKVLSLGKGKEFFSSGLVSGRNVGGTLVRAGEPLGVFYGLLTNGIWQKGEEIPAGFATTAGQVKFIDLNGDGKITPLDRTIIGNPAPDFTYGFTNNLSYKNLQLNVFLQGVAGGEILNADQFYFEVLDGESNITKRAFEGRWTDSNPSNAFPKAVKGRRLDLSDRNIENGSFLRVKNVTLSYQVPVGKSGVGVLKSLRVYLTGQNLMTFTKFSGFDPEVNNFGQDNLMRGITFGNYPQARTFLAGLNIGF
jgi:TonB-dependent starch-binding outer membrane protein SusC